MPPMQAIQLADVVAVADDPLRDIGVVTCEVRDEGQPGL